MKLPGIKTERRQSLRKSLPSALRSPVIWRGYENAAGLLMAEDAAKEHNRKSFAEADSAVAKELYEKLLLLSRHLGISPENQGWEFRLCLQLASMIYTGFQVKDRAFGRPKEWDIDRYVELMCDVEVLKREHEENGRARPDDTEAIDHLISKSNKGHGGRYVLKKGQTREGLRKTLQNRLVEAKSVDGYFFTARIFNNPDLEFRKAMYDTFIPIFASPEPIPERVSAFLSGM